MNNTVLVVCVDDLYTKVDEEEMIDDYVAAYEEDLYDEWWNNDQPLEVVKPTVQGVITC